MSTRIVNRTRKWLCLGGSAYNNMSAEVEPSGEAVMQFDPFTVLHNGNNHDNTITQILGQERRVDPVRNNIICIKLVPLDVNIEISIYGNKKMYIVSEI